MPERRVNYINNRGRTTRTIENNNRRRSVRTTESYNRSRSTGADKNRTKSHSKSGKAKRRKSIKSRLIILVILAAVIAIVKKPVLNYYYEYKLSQPVEKGEAFIKDGVTIMGEDVSGMTKEAADEYISDKFPAPQSDEAVTVKSSDGSKVYSYKFSDFEMEYDITSAVNDAVAFANEDLSESWWRDFKILEAGNVDFTVLKYNYPRIRSCINTIAKEVNIPVKNASVTRSNGQFVITKEEIGYEMDADKLLNEVMSAIRNSEFGKEITFDINVTNPEYTSDDFSEIDHKIGGYSSSYSGGDENRISNLKTACDKINGVVVYPGEVFSNNDKFNPCTEENGWKNAGTIVNGQIEDSIGGGMCQISSALYMAALEAELEIVERHNHSLKVGYMPYAYDATLAGDYKDLKFKNDTDKPIYIEAFTTDSQVVVRIYGKEIHDSTRKIEFENKLIETKEPDEPQIEYTNELPEGTEQVQTTALDGKTYELYKNVYENGELKETVKINTSVYSPRRQVILKGTKTAAEE